MPDDVRPDHRDDHELRPIRFKRDFAPYASGSVLCSFGDTRVICAATLEKKTPPWMRAQRVEGGWITAEYSMLPYSTLERKPRDISRGKLDGRTVEIQRLIGRSLRAIADLSKLPGFTLWLDCDVLQADGGTRTTSITGAYVAASLAIQAALADGVLEENPLQESVAAVSVGIYQDRAVLDLNYLEDRAASVDFNVVMTGNGRFVEVQGSGEEATFSREQFNALVELATEGIDRITTLQHTHLSGASGPA